MLRPAVRRCLAGASSRAGPAPKAVSAVSGSCVATPGCPTAPGSSGPVAARVRCFAAEAGSAGNGDDAWAKLERKLASGGAGTSATDRQKIPGNIYAPRIRYREDFVTEEVNPVRHTFRDVGRYFPLAGGSKEEVAATFPLGVAGGVKDLKLEFQVTGTHMMCIRPTGVFLVHRMEHWRQTHGRALAASGAAVKDIDPAAPYSEPDIGVPEQTPAMREAAARFAAARTKDLRMALAGDDFGPGSAGAAARKGALPAWPTDPVEAAAAAARAARTPPPLDASGRLPDGRVLEYLGSDLPRPQTQKTVAARQGGGWDATLIDPYAPEAACGPYTMLTGPRGIGKSALLTYAVAYARANRWIAIFIPDSLTVMLRGLVLVKSKRRPGFVDQHDMSLKILREVLTSQRDILTQVPQRGRYATFRYLPRARDAAVSAEREALKRAEEDQKARLKAEADAAGRAWDPSTFHSKYEDESDTAIDRSAFSLADMAEWGLAHPTASTDTLLDLLSELRQTTEFPVLIAVDGHNLMYEPTDYPQDGRFLAAEELSVPAAFHCLDRDGFRPDHAMARGLYLTTVTQAHGNPMRMFAVADVKNTFRLRVPEASREEVHGQLLHYHTSQNFLMVMDRSSVDPFAVEYYRAISGGRFKEVFVAATDLMNR